MNEGWIKLHRSLLDWEWFTDSNTLHVFIYLLLKANIKDVKYRGRVVPRGALVATVSDVGNILGLSHKAVRTALDHLKQSGQIETQATNKFTIITICKYIDYQVAENNERQTKGERTANEGQTNGKRRANLIEEEYKEDKKEIINNLYSLEGKKGDFEKREQDFRKELYQFVGEYSPKMLEDFAGYWLEKSRNGKKFRFEMEKTWSMKRRLATWADREKSFQAKKGGWGSTQKNASTTLESLIS